MGRGGIPQRGGCYHRFWGCFVPENYQPQNFGKGGFGIVLFPKIISPKIWKGGGGYPPFYFLGGGFPTTIAATACFFSPPIVCACAYFAMHLFSGWIYLKISHMNSVSRR